jgi:hypothetical protein
LAAMVAVDRTALRLKANAAMVLFTPTSRIYNLRCDKSSDPLLAHPVPQRDPPVNAAGIHRVTRAVRN